MSRQEKWALTESELRAALALLLPVISEQDVAWVAEFLDHNELGLAMDILVEAALASPTKELPPDTQSHLRRASAAMDGYTPEAWEAFLARFG